MSEPNDNMATEPRHSARSNKMASLTENVRGIAEDFSTLVSKEFALAKAEAEEKLGQVQSGIISAMIGVMAAFIALFVLAQALAVALSEFMEPWLATGLVALAFALIAVIAFATAETKLKPRNLKPVRTSHSVSETVRTVKESAQ